MSLADDVDPNNNDDTNTSQSEISIHETDQSYDQNDPIVQEEDDNLPPINFDVPSIPKLTQV